LYLIHPKGYPIPKAKQNLPPIHNIHLCASKAHFEAASSASSSEEEEEVVPLIVLENSERAVGVLFVFLFAK
jgi:hypothetical protein